MPGSLSHQATTADLLELITELIDAHADTVRLALDDDPGPLEWAAHCDYLRALQRLGHETLAHRERDFCPPPPSPTIASALQSALTAARDLFGDLAGALPIP
jgi:hypothetical protein